MRDLWGVRSRGRQESSSLGGENVDHEPQLNATRMVRERIDC